MRKNNHRMHKSLRKRAAKVGLPPGSLVYTGDVTDEPARYSVFQYNDTQVTEPDIGLKDLGQLRDKGGVFWLNVDGVHDLSVLEGLGREFGLHPLVLEDIAHTDQRPKVEDYGEYLYIVIKMLHHDGNAIVSEQVSMILGSNYVISFQEQGKPGDVFDPIRERIRTGAGRICKMGADFLAYSLIDTIVDNYFVILEHLSERIETLEDEVLQDPTPHTVSRLRELRRQMLTLRKSVWPLREVINGLQRGESGLVKDTTQLYLRDVYDHTIHVIDTIESLRDMLSGMQDVYLSSISFRMNEVMKVLTVIATVFIPLTFLVGVYGMNFEYLPELKWHWAYPVLWVIMLSIAGGMLYYFRRKKWL